MPLWDSIAEQISAATGQPFAVRDRHGMGGGCINAAHRIEDGARRYFVKLNDAARLDMFAAEAEGLQAIAAAGAIRVPGAVCWGVADDSAFLVLESLELGGSGDVALLGRNLAALHRVTWDRFGWHRDNTIGSTHQPNGPSADWVDFWRNRRLGFQLELAGGRLRHQGDELMERLPALFADYTPLPSLLHGDLWGGNFSFTRDGEPVIFDPAVYYGDRETDLAMTELFGGFGPRFYAAYREDWPLDPGYPVRKTLYNLYHVINHYNMFGGGYGGQAQSMMDQLLAELR